MNEEIHIRLIDFFIFLGIFQGLFLSWFFIKNGIKENKANLFQGILLLCLALGMFEELVNTTGYIVKLLPITNYGEPTNFALAPLFYFYIKYSLEPNKKHVWWPHFIIAFFWLVYMFLFAYFQSNEVKYNSFVHTNHPDWQYLPTPEGADDDPWMIRRYINQMTLVMFVVYMGASIMLQLRKFKALGQGVFKTNNETLIVLRNITLHFIAIILVFMATKLYYGMDSDIGGYLIASYVSLMIYTTSYQVLNRSDFFKHPHSFLDFPMPKYQKSSLSEEAKEQILVKIKKEMERNSYFTNNLASLSGLAKQINESSHHVSQVINEKMNKNFFELLAGYRVEFAQKLIREDREIKLTVEELAERVGYNSKSSFNTAFKKITSQTPSEFRENNLRK